MVAPASLASACWGARAGCKGKKEEKNRVWLRCYLATEAHRFEPPHLATVRGERTASAFRNISNMHSGTCIRACAMVTAVYIIPEQQLSVC